MHGARLYAVGESRPWLVLFCHLEPVVPPLHARLGA